MYVVLLMRSGVTGHLVIGNVSSEPLVAQDVLNTP